MEKKTIYLIRHGETDYNKKGAVQGRGIDASLNETGRKQARAFFEKYRDIPFQKIYISSLCRTYQTVEDFIKLGIPFQKLTSLDEISWGTAEGQTISETGYEIFKDLLSKWNMGKTSEALEGGESPDQVQERQREALKVILAEEDAGLILVCMHGRAMRIFLSTLMGNSLSEMDRYHHSNTCLYILEYDLTTQTFEISLENSTAHLQEFNA